MTDIVETPNKKRKRTIENPGYFSNSLDIPTSTPINKSYDNPSFRYNSSNKENNFFSDSCMEVKSIAELVAERSALASKTNEYEVIRKPPKKKKKADKEESCFENPGLDLNAAEKPLNPFEVIREDKAVLKLEGADHCFTNPCLNINVPERTSTNPFEVPREREPVKEKEPTGIENPGLDLQSYALMLPITPNINHRIDFNKIPESALTPCSMLSNKLVIDTETIVPATPKRNSVIKQKKSLSTISEELDIGEELDCYQLELENSINEAKAKNQKYKFDVTKTFKAVLEEEITDIDNVATPTPMEKEMNNETYTKEKTDMKDLPEVIEIVEPKNTVTATATATNSNEIKLVINDRSHNLDLNINIKLNQENEEKPEASENADNTGVQYEEVEDDEIDFQKPAPFQRAYRKNLPKPSEDFKVPSAAAPKHKFGDSIRRSIRKLMHHDKPEKTEKDKVEPEAEKEGLLSSIRHSLRRKPKTVPLSVDDLEMSIVVDESRHVFKENKVEIKTTSEIKSTIIRNSLRRSTKDVKKQVMKSVFQKKVEEFNLF
jgi:hypothetical protein